MQWQKQNSETLLKENEEVFQHEVNQLKRKARELEKERNILLTTIKQENIKIPKLKHVGLGFSAGKYAIGAHRRRKKNRSFPTKMQQVYSFLHEHSYQSIKTHFLSKSSA